MDLNLDNNIIDSRRNQIEHSYMAMAYAVALRSYAKKRQVGAIAVKDGNLISMGYNGTPQGWSNQCEDSNNKTFPYVLHAEANLVAKLAKSTVSSNGCVVFTTTAPCFDCAKLLYQAGVARVVYDEDFKNEDGVNFLKKCNIEIRKQKDNK